MVTNTQKFRSANFSFSNITSLFVSDSEDSAISHRGSCNIAISCRLLMSHLEEGILNVYSTLLMLILMLYLRLYK